MNNILLDLMCICAIFSGVSGLTTAPVFVVDDSILRAQERYRANPFSVVLAEEFVSLARELQRASETLVFYIEESLCAEDVSTRDFKGTPYNHLSKIHQAKRAGYLPQVQTPYLALREQFKAFPDNSFLLQRNTSTLRLDKSYKYMYIFFVDDRLNETRVEMLRRHDMTMITVLLAIRQYASGPVTALYTGKHNPILSEEELMKQREGSAAKDSKWTTQECGNATFEFHDARLVNGIEAKLFPAGCLFVVAPELFGYDVLFRSEMRRRAGKAYRLRLTFKPRQGGWEWTEAVWMTDTFNTLSSQAMNQVCEWNAALESAVPLSMRPAEWYEPSLVIDKCRIRLFLKENLRYSLSSTLPRAWSEATPYPPRRYGDEDRNQPERNQPDRNQPARIQHARDQPHRTQPTRYRDGRGGKARAQLKGPMVEDLDLPPPNPLAEATSNPPAKQTLNDKPIFLTMTLVMSGIVVFMLLNILLQGVQTLYLCQSNNRMDTHETKALTSRDGGLD